MLRMLKWFMPSLILILVFYLAVTPSAEHSSTTNTTENERSIPKTPSSDSQKNLSATEVSESPETSEPVNEILPRYIYKWRDTNNVIVISSDPPPEDISAEAFIISEEPKVTERRAETIIQPNRNDIEVPDFVSSPLKVYTPDGLRELIEYSKEVGEKIQLRGEMLDDLVEQL